MKTIETTNQFILNTYKRYPVVFEKGTGCYLFDENGKKYLDMSSGIAVSLLGHSHPEVVKAIKKQSNKLLHTSNLYYSTPAPKLAKKLVEKSVFSKAFFCNSGAEANEAALKIAKKYGKIHGGEKKFKILSFKNSFHGRTIATITATGQTKYQESFTPLLPGVEYAEYNNIESVKKLISDDVCAVIIEPLQGEGGVHPAQGDFIKQLRELCDKHNALLIFDEIQTGVGRTGTLFAYEQFLPTKPDIVTLAKGIAAGLPMGVTLVNEKLSEVLQPGDHASTFGGNLLTSSVALAVLNCIDNDKILENVQKSGSYLIKKLNELKLKYSSIKDIRGQGLLIGIEIDFPAPELVNALIDKKIITVPAGTSVVRFLPPLIIKKKEIDILIDALDEIFKKRI
ncbi:MAG: acetylornithine aminotransferase [Spirochaetes bacterium GWF1_31_7]|nr:MAG: acetylornithine aminotransferase [Spirochaetes bacterium GWE1_32_154]OHD47285.1 MAG: acetylornithine aminotransferase [Spirochaetes bacterium GWF1_31_7]OHD49463.1 MAG: acetylornithine aminotransferase [Spirochaetes bacterium GWE2_31_10]OHD80574.1 MAG: acetylornithine aminotransferase [Spirochaetes bacterium RIFOXYB1_FULL_32_8]HBD96544.1 aspartate aminotransferase family protein [Spirochaetia bacterium]